MNDKTVREWALYEAGKKYNQSIRFDDKDYYETVDVNIAFANGNQWRNVNADTISKPVVPIIQKAKQHIIANVTSTSISASISPLEHNAEEQDENSQKNELIADMTNAEIRNLFDRLKFEFKVKDGLSDAFDMGDMCIHTLWNTEENAFKGSQYELYKGVINAELVDGPNVLFGNPNNADPQKQPYIILVGRDLTTTLQDEVEKGKKNDIFSDLEYTYQAGDLGKIELETDDYGKSLYLLVYKKVKGKILATKCVQGAYIYKDKDTGLTRYPIAWMNYRKQKNCYHGIAGCTGLIPNQIAVNKLVAMIIYSVMNTAFPKLVYDADRISGLTNKIGEQIGIRDRMPNESIRDVASYLETGQVSNQVISTIELLVSYTKDMLGINDAAVGNVNPDNTSAMALAEKLSSVPLENLRSNLYEFTEQFVDNLIDMISSKYGTRPVTVTNGDNTSIQMFDFSLLKDFNSSKRIDVGAIGYASELSAIKELRDLLELGSITVVEYLERIPENRVPKVKELIANIKMRLGMVNAEEQRANEEKWNQMLAFIETLPQETQEQLKKLPDADLEKAVAQLMEQAPQQAEMVASQNLNQAMGQII